jgi:hypothetical protein
MEALQISVPISDTWLLARKISLLAPVVAMAAKEAVATNAQQGRMQMACFSIEASAGVPQTGLSAST